jgi:SAM-dependent methyltransferase
MKPTPAPDAQALRDPVGAATLERMATAQAFNRWMYDRLAPWVGRRVLEVGSGIGNMSQFFADRERVVLTDTDAGYRETLRTRFVQHPNVAVRELSLPEVPDGLVAERFDTIVCLNVLEHIEDDLASLAAMRGLLVPGGRLVLLVPALPFLYGSLDRALGHYRRYTKALLRQRCAAAGLAIRHLEYFNLGGIPGWWFAARVMKRESIPPDWLGLYDKLVPLFRLEQVLPWRIGQSLIAIGGWPGG